jgi:hypothetical protein
VQDFLIDWVEGRQNLEAVPPLPAFMKLRPSRESAAKPL